MGKISQYARALKAKLADLFVVAQSENGELSTKGVTVEQIGDTIAGEQVHSSHDTDDKTLIGSINEVQDNLDTLTATTLPLTTNPADGTVSEAIGDLVADTTITSGNLTRISSALTVTRSNVWVMNKIVFCTANFSLSGQAPQGHELMSFPTGIDIPSAYDMFAISTNGTSYPCYAYQGKIIANSIMPASTYAINFVAKSN